MRRLNGKRGPLVLFEKRNTIHYEDDWCVIANEENQYDVDFVIMLLFDWEGFRWLIHAGDFTCCEKHLVDCAMLSLRLLAENSPKYDRLVTHLYKKELWFDL